MLPILLGCASCSKVGSVQGNAPTELPLPERIQVVFNHRDGARYRSPLNAQWRNGDNLEIFVITSIEQAQQEILVAVQELSLPGIADALVAAKQRGVNVQMVIENSFSQPWGDQHEADMSLHERHRVANLKMLADRNHDGELSPKERYRGDAMQILRRHQIPLIDDREDGSKGSGLMHHKFLVIDHQIVITGSANFSHSGMHGDPAARQTRGNVNHLLSFKSTELAELFKKEFLLMWGDGPGGAKNSMFGLAKNAPGIQTAKVGGTRIEVLFAPHTKRQKMNGLQFIAKQIETSKQSIDMALFIFSAQALVDKLWEQMQSGVKICLIADPSFASRSYSEVLDLLGLALPDHRCKLEVGNKPFAVPLEEGVGTARLASGDKLHHKFAVIDNKKVITGSFNWTPAAAHTNDETLLVIHSPLLAKHFTREMDRLWRGAELGITAHMQRKLKRQLKRCRSGVIEG